MQFEAAYTNPKKHLLQLSNKPVLFIVEFHLIPRADIECSVFSVSLSRTMHNLMAPEVCHTVVIHQTSNVYIRAQCTFVACQGG